MFGKTSKNINFPKTCFLKRMMWTAYLFVWMGRRRAGLVDCIAWWVIEDSGSFLLLFCVLCLRGSDLGRRLSLCFRFFFHLELYLVEIIYVLDSSYVDDMAFVEMYLISTVTFMLRYIHAWLLGDYCRRDDYFLFMYWNCMIYRLNRNRALHTCLTLLNLCRK